MELSDFLRQTQQEVRAEIEDQLSSPGSAYPCRNAKATEKTYRIADRSVLYLEVICTPT